MHIRKRGPRCRFLSRLIFDNNFGYITTIQLGNFFRINITLCGESTDYSWKLTMVLRQESWLASPRRTSEVTTQWMCGGAANHGSFRKPWPIPIYHNHLSRSNKTMQFLKQNYLPIESVSPASRRRRFPGEYVAVHARWGHNGKRM